MIYGIKYILKRIKYYYCLGELNKKWRKKNKSNNSSMNRLCDISKVSVGRYTYGPLNVHDFKNESTLKIGNCCSIADEVHFFLGGGHDVNALSTYPYKKNVLLEEKESISKGNIIIEDDVWIGSHVIILSGVRIGRGCVVAAGSVVSKSIPPYSIVGGVPARLIRKRFDDDTIAIIEKIDFNKFSDRLIKTHIDALYSCIDSLSCDEIKSIVDKINDDI